MENIKILFMGTTDYAACILNKLIDNGYDVIGIVSQPDRPQGRKKELIPTYTKQVGLDRKIPVYAYENINEHIQEINDLNVDLIITCAYGQKISVDILNHPRLRAINVHSSLLPKYRGGAPIHHAIINGEKVTGNTIMYMEAGLDTGDILASSLVDIDIKDTVSTLYPKLMEDGASLLVEMLPDLIQGKIKPIKQDDSKACFAGNITKQQEYITFDRDVMVVYNHMRGLINWPGCYAYLNQKKIKFHDIFFDKNNHNKTCGSIEVDNKEYFKIYCKGGYIKVFNFQLEGKKAVDFKDYLNGNKLEIETGVRLNEGMDA